MLDQEFLGLLGFKAKRDVMSKKADFSLRKRGTVWYARKRHKGKEHEISLDTEDKGIAYERAKKWVDGLIAQEWGEKPTRTFDEAMIRYAEERFTTLAEKTAERYAVSMEHLHAHFAGMPLNKITMSSLMELERKRRQKVKPATDDDGRHVSSFFGSSISVSGRVSSS